MDRDGSHKTDLTKESKEFAYGFSGWGVNCRQSAP